MLTGTRHQTSVQMHKHPTQVLSTKVNHGLEVTVTRPCGLIEGRKHALGVRGGGRGNLCTVLSLVATLKLL